MVLVCATPWKFTKSGASVLDLFLRTELIAKDCLLEDYFRWFVGCDGDSNYAEGILPFSFTVFTAQRLEEISAITISYEVFKAAAQYLAGMVGWATIRRWTVWQVQGALLSTPLFPVDVTQLVPQVSFYPSSFEQEAHILYKLWAEHWYAGLNSLYVKFILAHKFGMLGVMIKPSSISH